MEKVQVNGPPGYKLTVTKSEVMKTLTQRSQRGSFKAGKKKTRPAMFQATQYLPHWTFFKWLELTRSRFFTTLMGSN